MYLEKKSYQIFQTIWGIKNLVANGRSIAV